jgi:two-component system, sensor histidine kinase YesM
MIARPRARTQRTVSIQETLMRVFVFSIMIPIVLIDVLAYSILDRTAYRGYADDIRNVISSMDENFSIYFDQLENQLNQLSASSNIVTLLSQDSRATSLEAVEVYQAASNRINQSLGARSDVASIRAYDLSGELMYSRNMVYGKVGREEDARILAALADSGYGCQYYGVRKILSGEKEGLSFFTLACKVIDLGKRASCGYLLVDLNYNMIDKFSSWNSIDGDFILAFDGKVAYSKSASLQVGSSFDDALVRRMGEKRFNFLYSSPSSRWQYLVVADRLHLMNAVVATAFWIVAVSVLCFIAFFFLFRAAIGKVLASLNRLEVSMRGAEENGFGRIEYLEDPYVETRRLIMRFNAMQAEILGLMGKQEELLSKKASLEQEALQLQIAPHFLYNSLDSINCLAAIKGQREISEMVVALSEIFKYTAGGGEKGVTLSQEIEYAKNYCALQAIRYQESFRVEFAVPPEYNGLGVVKFMLQPLIENAISHGVGLLPKDGLIRIGAEEEGGRVCVYVWNNGAPFAEEALAEYRRLFSRPDLSPPSLQGGGRIGLANIFFRLRLQFGPGAGMEIGTGEGTKVKILLPKEGARV